MRAADSLGRQRHHGYSTSASSWHFVAIVSGCTVCSPSSSSSVRLETLMQAGVCCAADLRAQGGQCHHGGPSNAATAAACLAQLEPSSTASANALATSKHQSD
jgi:hypothetical protein